MASRKKNFRVPTEKQMTEAFVKLLMEGPDKLTRDESINLGDALDKVGENYFIVSSSTDGDWDNNIEPKHHYYKISVKKLKKFQP